MKTTKSIKGLKFSHQVGNIYYNNVGIDAYYLDDETYRLDRYLINSSRSKVGTRERLDIKIEDYENLGENSYGSFAKFQEVNNLFSAKDQD